MLLARDIIWNLGQSDLCSWWTGIWSYVLSDLERSWVCRYQIYRFIQFKEIYHFFGIIHVQGFFLYVSYSCYCKSSTTPNNYKFSGSLLGFAATTKWIGFFTCC